MKTPLKAIFLFGLLWNLEAKALSLESSLEQSRTSATVSTEFSQMSVEDESISGSGLKLGMDLLISNHLSSEFLLATTLDPNNSFQTSYTTIGLYVSYNFFDASSYTRKFHLEGKNILTENHKADQQLRLGAGFEQVLLNGSRGVYSASGPGIELTYQKDIFGWNTVFGVRRTLLKSNELSVECTAFNVGLSFPL